jgi:hypothetical protein
MDLHSKMIMYVTSKMTSPVTKTAKKSKWLRLQFFIDNPALSHLSICSVLVTFLYSTLLNCFVLEHSDFKTKQLRSVLV